MADLQLGWIGLGVMGRGIIKNLVTKGPLTKPLLIYNRTPARAEALSASLGPNKVTIASSIDDLVTKCDLVITCVSDDRAATETYETAAKAANITGKIFVDCSTLHPKTTTSIDELLKSKGGRFVSSPLLGPAAAAEAATLVFILASNDASAIDTYEPLIKGIMGRSIIRLEGKPPAMASILKLSGNHFIFSMILTISESLHVATQTGLGKEAVLRYLQELFPGPYVYYAQRMISGDYIRDEPLFQVDLALKDTRHAMDLAKDKGVRVGTLEEVERQLMTVKKECAEKGDVAGMYGAKRVESGLQYKEEKLD